jgi:hypothetical protein
MREVRNGMTKASRARNKGRTIRLSLFIFALVAVSLAVINSQDRPRIVHATPKHTVFFDAAGLRVEQRSYLDNLTVLLIDGQTQYAVEDNFVFVSEDGGLSFEQRGVLPKRSLTLVSRVYEWLARSRLVRSIRRNRGPGLLTVLPSGTILVFYDNIYRSTDGGRSFEIFDYPTKDFARPFNNRIAVTPDGEAILGEYPTSSRPTTVRVLRGRDDGRQWDYAYEFAKGELFHIHSTVWDSDNNRILLMSGDNDDESAIYAADIKFERVLREHGGDQGWRIVSLSRHGSTFFWGSDNDRSGSHIYSLKRNERTIQQYIGNTSYDSTTLDGPIFVVTTTLEPRSRFVKDNSDYFGTGVWIATELNAWTKAISFDQSRALQDAAELWIRPRLQIPESRGLQKDLTITPRWHDPDVLCKPPCTAVLSIDKR